MPSRRVSLWMQPEQAAASELDAVIARLACVHGSAAFPAHLTVLPSVAPQVDTAGLVRLAELCQPLRVRFDETRFEQAWQRSLYLTAVPEPALRRLVDLASGVFGVPEKSAFEPHLSLHYSRLPVADKLGLASGMFLDLPLTVRFDRLSLWDTTGSDAGRWRLLAAHSLAAGSR
jgi:hypothetical protein